MGIIRRIIFIIVLLGLAFVFYRLFNPQWADALIARLRWTQIVDTISDIKNQNLISTWENLSWKIDTWISNTWLVSTWIIQTWTILTWLISSWTTDIWSQSSWEIVWIVDTMSWFSEIIDSTASAKLIKWDINYKNSDYGFSISFPWSWDGYTIQIETWKDIKSEFIFSFAEKDYFIIYVISNTYYQSNKSLDFSYLTYLSQDATNTFAYKTLENSDTKSKAVPYILKTFKLNNLTTPTIPTTITPITNKVPVKTTTVKKTYPSDSNNIRAIWESFIK